MGFVDAKCTGGVMSNFRSVIDWATCRTKQVSLVSGRPVCYSTEALKYVQTSCFFAIVLCQISNSMTVWTRKVSVFNQGLGNFFMLFGWVIETTLILVLAYIYPVNIAIGTRDLSLL